MQLHNRLKKEAKERGEEYKIPKLRRNIEMDEYDLMHWRRSLEEREALIRDISWYSFNFLLAMHSGSFLTRVHSYLKTVSPATACQL